MKRLFGGTNLSIKSWGSNRCSLASLSLLFDTPVLSPGPSTKSGRLVLLAGRVLRSKEGSAGVMNVRSHLESFAAALLISHGPLQGGQYVAPFRFAPVVPRTEGR